MVVFIMTYNIFFAIIYSQGNGREEIGLKEQGKELRLEDDNIEHRWGNQYGTE